MKTFEFTIGNSWSIGDEYVHILPNNSYNQNSDFTTLCNKSLSGDIVVSFFDTTPPTCQDCINLYKSMLLDNCEVTK
jgi:hypothetical protein